MDLVAMDRPSCFASSVVSLIHQTAPGDKVECCSWQVYVPEMNESHADAHRVTESLFATSLFKRTVRTSTSWQAIRRGTKAAL
jgi:hypothetical protein